MSEHAIITEGDTPTAPPESAAPTADAPETPEGSRTRRDVGFFLIALAVIALDQLTKHIVRATVSAGEPWPNSDWVVHIVNVSNSGAAFGMLQGQTTFLVITSLVGVAAITLYYFYPPMEHGLLRLALGLQLGGAAGNLIDRVRFGEVTDFVNTDFFPAFNVADSSITIGVVAILLFFLAVEVENARGQATPDE